MEIDHLERLKFLKNDYYLTASGGLIPYFYGIDTAQSFLFSIRYSGEVQIIPLKNQANKHFLKAISKTNFIDTFWDNATRIKS